MKTRHPEKQKLSAAIADDLDRIKARKGRIDAHKTYFHTAEAPGEGTGAIDLDAANMRPTDEQLARVNKFTRSPKTADEVAVFPTLSCNNLIDRDDDQFTTQCVKEFAELPDPYSPVGKSYMVDHNYSIHNAVGRIFGVGTKKVSGATFLTNEVYVPNTESNQKFLEDIDFGINWAVSVGVVLGKDECSLPWCKEPFSSWGWWCRAGHDKGLFYTEDAEEDSWGWPTPCDPKTAGAQQCIRLFMEPRDFYELSQVFLGAQYHAQLADKDAEFAGILKAASANVPVIGLKREEAKKIPKLRHLPDKVAEAYARYEVKEEEDGSISWIAADGLLYMFDAEDLESGVQCLGKAVKAADDDDDDEEVDDGEEQLDEHDSGDEGSSDGEDDQSDSEDEQQSGEVSEAAAGGEQPLGGEPGSEGQLTEAADPGEDEDEEKGASLNAKTVMAAAVKANLPQEVMAALVDAKGHGLDALLSACSSEITTLRSENQKLSGRAEMGEQYLKDVRAEAIDWFVKANADPGSGKGVNTDEFEKLLDRCGDDIELIRSMGERERKAAQARFGRKTTRSSFGKGEGVNQRPEGDDGSEGKSPWDDETAKRSDATVSKIHG